jgi:hypothetical protein
MHALFKIRKNLDFQKLTPKLAIKIFDGIVSPILLYNSEVWGPIATTILLNGTTLVLRKHI